MNSRSLALLYRNAHNRMRDIEGLLPQEAFDELLKFLFYKEHAEDGNGNPATEIHPSQASAHTIRSELANHLAEDAPWALQLWPSGHFQLSDHALLSLRDVFSDVRLADLSLDVRSTAIHTFLSPEVRKGLGIFTTPEGVVRAMVEVANPKPHELILDPACGTGTFLQEAAHHLSRRATLSDGITLFGVDKNPRMLLLAELNLGSFPGINFQRACVDSLKKLGRPPAPPLGLSLNSVDLILTNPPFGVMMRDTGVPDLFGTHSLSKGKSRSRIPSELLFVELCLRLLRPGGRLAIVLPRSTITNESFGAWRRATDQLGHLSELVDLPPETFASTGTQTTTVAAFFTKHDRTLSESSVSVRVCRITNVDHDTTGRHRPGNQLPILGQSLARTTSSDTEPNVITYSNIPNKETLQRASSYLFGRNGRRTGIPIREFVAAANTGRTPSRRSYTDSGTFIIKVGNLTGRGIDWEPRDRNFVSEAEGEKRAISHSLSIERGDILLTSSAHAARYIAKKVDIVYLIPERYSTLTFVGELIRIRPASDIDPFHLLAILGYPSVREDIQSCVRGQTAHLNPNDVLDVTVPYDLRTPTQEMADLAGLLRQEARISFDLNEIASKSPKLIRSTDAANIN